MSDKPLFVGRPNIGDKADFDRHVDAMFDKHWLTNDGELVRELESTLADYLGVSHCIALCNGTVALELAIKALEMHTEVIVPSMTFIATAHALQWQGVKPVFADIDRDNYNLCPRSVESMITEKTTGIIGVHLYGRPCNIKALEALAHKYSLKLAFDAAHAFGSAYGDAMLGRFGDCEVFSFHATKVFNTFEGGAITTNDSQLAEKLRLMRNFGFAEEDRVIHLGINGKMAEINAAMGLTNLNSLENFIAHNKRNYQAYKKGLNSVNGIRLIEYKEAHANNFHYIIIEIEEEQFGHSRDKLKAHLQTHKVHARRYFYPGCHLMEPYKSMMPEVDQRLPHTNAFSKRMLALPNGSQLDIEAVAWICSLIKDLNEAAK